eukprot:1149744-Pelagomonas_calceolata.AAC.2
MQPAWSPTAEPQRHQHLCMKIKLLAKKRCRSVPFPEIGWGSVLLPAPLTALILGLALLTGTQAFNKQHKGSSSRSNKQARAQTHAHVHINTHATRASYPVRVHPSKSSSASTVQVRHLTAHVTCNSEHMNHYRGLTEDGGEPGQQQNMPEGHPAPGCPPHPKHTFSAWVPTHRWHWPCSAPCHSALASCRAHSPPEPASDPANNNLSSDGGNNIKHVQFSSSSYTSGLKGTQTGLASWLIELRFNDSSKTKHGLKTLAYKGSMTYATQQSVWSPCKQFNLVHPKHPDIYIHKGRHA